MYGDVLVAISSAFDDRHSRLIANSRLRERRRDSQSALVVSLSGTDPVMEILF